MRFEEFLVVVARVIRANSDFYGKESVVSDDFVPNAGIMGGV
jgi:hypothetical protein